MIKKAATARRSIFTQASDGDALLVLGRSELNRCGDAGLTSGSIMVQRKLPELRAGLVIG